MSKSSGIYFPIGGAFATALKEYGYQTSAEATNATGQNIQNILNSDAEIAIAMQDAVMQAYTGTGAYEGKGEAGDLRALMRLWPNYVQLVTVSSTGIKSVEDLRGKRVGVGAANSGVEINARMILNAYGITYDDIKPDYLAYGEAIDNMKNGQCDAVFVTSGPAVFPSMTCAAPSRSAGAGRRASCGPSGSTSSRSASNMVSRARRISSLTCVFCPIPIS